LPSFSPSGFAYRSEPKDNLLSIAGGGLWCEPATKLDWLKSGMKLQYPDLDLSIPLESGMAKLENWDVPPALIIACPRLYFWLDEKNATDGSINTMVPENVAYSAAGNVQRRVLVRFPFSVLTKHIYPDGCFRIDSAYYCVFPDSTVKTIVVKACFIEVQLDQKWLSLVNYILT
jgi:hypothetical protein